MRLILIRHGESEHSIRRMIAGKGSCAGLTRRGFKQAQELADLFVSTGELHDCSLLLSSPVLRARQTAEVLAQTLHLDLAAVDCDLCELHVGQAEGLSWEEYSATYTTFDLTLFPSRSFAPEGESWLDFTERVQTTLYRLAQQFEGRTVVAVTHAGFIVASVLVLFDIPRPGTGAYLDPDFASITEWYYTGSHWKLVRFNDVPSNIKRLT